MSRLLSRDEHGLRMYYDVWDPGRALPGTVNEVAREALALAASDVLQGYIDGVGIARFAKDGVSLWTLSNPGDLPFEDILRAISRAFEPEAYALAVVEAMFTEDTGAVGGLRCRAALGDDLIELKGVRTGPNSTGEWTLRRGRVEDDRGRWLGVPPTVPIELPMLGAAEA